MIFIYLTVILLLLIYFEALEMSLVSSDESRLANYAGKYRGRYRIAYNIRRRPEIFFSTVLIGINLMTVLFSMILTREIGITMGLIISTLLIALIGEILVKSLVIINPEIISAVVSPPIMIFYWMFLPLIFMVRAIGDGILMIFGIKSKSRENITKREMNTAVREAKAAGNIAPEQYRAMKSIARLSLNDVRDIMIHRVDIIAFNINEGSGRLIDILKNVNVSKIPVYKETIDNIIGILFKEDIMGSGKEWKISRYLRPIKFIHGDRSLDEVLPELLSDKNSCAIVIDEYGGTEGFVSTDDILFNIFSNEFEIEEGEEGTFIVAGGIRPENLGIITDEDTLAGYIVRELQEIPTEGQKLKIDGWVMTIIDATERKIKKVMIKRE